VGESLEDYSKKRTKTDLSGGGGGVKPRTSLPEELVPKVLGGGDKPKEGGGGKRRH